MSISRIYTVYFRAYISVEFVYVFNELQDGSSSRYLLAMGSVLNPLQEICVYMGF
jgi:hypothetical protein